MPTDIKSKIKSRIHKKNADETAPVKISPLKLKTTKTNQFLTFFKPEVFLDKTSAQIEKIMDLVFEKFDQHAISIDGATIFPGPALARFSIMDRHYGVINNLSKNASKVLTPEQKAQVHEKLGIKSKNLKILGGHEAFAIAGIPTTLEFDKFWLEFPSTKINSGFYGRVMTIADEETVVINGFHPHQLAHYTAPGRKLVVLLISSDSSWKTIREEMLGDVFPEKAPPHTIRGTFYQQAKEFGFESVGIANNILHISAGPTEALFEIDNFFRESFGMDIVKNKALLASKLLMGGLKGKEIKDIIHDKTLHAALEHKETVEAVDHILLKRANHRQV